MKVVFLQDFRGRETAEQFYTEGEEVDLPDGMADRLIYDGRAVSAELVLPKPGDSYLVGDDGPEKFTPNESAISELLELDDAAEAHIAEAVGSKTPAPKKAKK